MIKSYILIALRNIRKHAGYSSINIAGLAIGMACCILILLYVRDELSFDRYHANAQRIYRVESNVNMGGQATRFVTSPHPLGPAMLGDFPEVEHAVRFLDRPIWFKAPHQAYAEERVLFTDADVFDVFSFPLLRGNPETALVEPFSIVITKNIARKYLEQGEPLGQTLDLRWEGERVTCHVTGILEDMPQNSHFRAEVLLSYSSLDTLQEPDVMQNWAGFNTYTYLLLHEGADAADMTSKLPQFVEKYVGQLARQFFGEDVSADDMMKLSLRPLTDIYLHSRQEHEIGATGDIMRIYIFVVIALLILVVACVNFVNLSTARSAGRAKEVGLRKVMGAGRLSLIGQFIGEAVILSLLAMGIACALVELSLPVFNAFTGKALVFWSAETPLLLPALILFAVFVGIAAGAYPAFFLSGFQPARVLKGTQRSGSGGLSLWLRKGLVILQFAISILLIIGTLIVAQQMEYLRGKNLGLLKDQVLIVSYKDRSLLPDAGSVKTALLQQSGVQGVTASSDILGGQDYNTTTFRLEGSAEEDWQIMYQLLIDDQFLPTLDIPLAAGRNFSADLMSDSETSCIINETAMARFGWNSPETAVGQRI